VLVVFAIGAFFMWHGGVKAVKQVFTKTRVVACMVLAVALSLYVIEAHQIHGMTQIAIGLLVVALFLEAIDHRENRSFKAAISARIK
jgi:hypothetical protein